MADRKRGAVDRTSSAPDVHFEGSPDGKASPAGGSALRRVGIVSYDFSGKSDFSVSTDDWPPAYHQIHPLLDGVGCDAIFYPLLPAETSFASTAPDKPAFEELKSVRYIYAGTTPDPEGRRRVSAWIGDVPQPRVMTEHALTKDQFIRDPVTILGDLQDRVFDNAFLLFAGEMNAITFQRSTGDFLDHVGLIPFFEERQVSIVLNPASYYMRRWQIRLKRLFLSHADRTVISLWSKKAWPKPEFVGEAARPWAAYQGGDVATSEIMEIPSEAHGLGSAVYLAVLVVPSEEEA
jgi:hypothetical protein